ncbi:site-specific integrase, partial [Vibrio fluvialis]
FLRREEAANLKMGNFIASPQGWSLRFVGKGDKWSTIIVTSKLMDELKVYRTSLGLPALPSPGESRPAIMAVTGVDKGVTGQAIYLICKEIFGWAADLIEGSDNAAAARLRQSSPHWMRHTGVSHSMEMGVDPRYVQAQARHSSLNITARYDHKKRQAWRDAFNAADNSKK